MNKHDAFRIIQAIASDRDPFSENGASSNRPENNPETVKALCVVLAEVMRSSADPILAKQRNYFEETLIGNLSLEEASKLYEKETIAKVLEQCKHNQAEAARRLGMTYRSLRYKIEQYGIE